jgi:uncharacterized protein
VSVGVFVDTSAWFAVADRGDAYHVRATELLRSLLQEDAGLATTNHVIGETYTLVRTKLGAREAREFLNQIGASAAVRRIFVLEDWEIAAEDLLLQFADQPFSYIDATSFVAMRRLGLREAFTFDRHFAVVGFILSENVR